MGVKVEFVRGKLDSAKLAQHITELESDGHTVKRVEVHAGDRTEEGVWVESVRPLRRGPHLPVRRLFSRGWAREYNVVSRVASRFVGADLNSIT